MMHVWRFHGTQLGFGPRWLRHHHPRMFGVLVLMLTPLAVLAARIATVLSEPVPVEQPTPPAATTRGTAGPAGDAQGGEYIATVFGCQDCYAARIADGVHLDWRVLLAGGEPFPGPWGAAQPDA